jgi:type II secretory pathway pseudopilin PulG
MKKHDEGYVLAYVTVVLLIFCLVAAVILTGAMRNLNHQQDSIQKMKDQYVAEGMIEQVLAQLDKKGETIFIDCNSFKRTEEDAVITELTATIDEGLLVLVSRSGEVTVTYTLELTATSAVSFENQLTITGLKSYTFAPNQPVADEEGGLPG